MIIDMLVQASSDLETHFVSVERVKEYSAVVPEVFMRTDAVVSGRGVLLPPHLTTPTCYTTGL